MPAENEPFLSLTDDKITPSPVETPRQAIGSMALFVYGLVSASLLWLAGPPCGLFFVALIAITPLLFLIKDSRPIQLRGWLSLHLGMTMYFLVSLQGLRHAHPAMFLAWIALAAYLAIYPVLFVAVCRRITGRRSLVLIAPLAWVATEWIRNYLMTGISVLMLGHTQANAPMMIQIAELFGTYGVSFVVVCVNITALAVFRWARNRAIDHSVLREIIVGLGVLAASLVFGSIRLAEAEGNDKLATFLLLQRSEPVKYGQTAEREIEIFQNYARDAIRAVQRSDQPIDGVVWPESMFSGAMHWMEAEDSLSVPAEAGVTPSEFRTAINLQRAAILDRSRTLVSLMNQDQPPHLLAGCGVVRYGEHAKLYSGVLHVTPDSRVDSWYGKRHLVMFGEYIPLLPHLPILKRLVPPELGIASGRSTVIMDVNGTRVSPSICIETAVERVTLAQVQSGHGADSAPDVIVTVTNDGWFSQSSVIDHHLRCVQLSAVGCARPILSAANNGPTAWVDDKGRIVKRLNTGDDGRLIATPTRVTRRSIYSVLSDWPPCFATLVCGLMLASCGLSRRRLSGRPGHPSVMDEGSQVVSVHEVVK